MKKELVTKRIFKRSYEGYEPISNIEEDIFYALKKIVPTSVWPGIVTLTLEYEEKEHVH